MRISDWLSEKIKGDRTRLDYASLILATVLLLVLLFVVISSAGGRQDSDDIVTLSDFPDGGYDGHLTQLPRERTSLEGVDKLWGAAGCDTTATAMLDGIFDNYWDDLETERFFIDDPENAAASEWPLVEVGGCGIERAYKRLYNNIMSASLADERYFGGVMFFVEVVAAALFLILFLLLLLVIVFKRFGPRRAVEVDAKPKDRASVRLYSPDPEKCIYPERAIEDDLAFFLSSNDNVIVRGNKEYLANVMDVLHRYSPAKKVVRVCSGDLAGSGRLSLLKREYIGSYHDAVQYAEAVFDIFRSEKRYERNEFFIKSAKLLMAECIWFLRKYEDGAYCDFPHLVRLTLCAPEQYVSIFKDNRESGIRTGFLKDAIERSARDQFVGQVADLNITLSSLYENETLRLTDNDDGGGHFGVAVLVEDSDSVIMRNIEELLAVLESGIADIRHKKYVSSPKCFRNIRFGATGRKAKMAESRSSSGVMDEGPSELFFSVDQDIESIIERFCDHVEAKRIEQDEIPLSRINVESERDIISDAHDHVSDTPDRYLDFMDGFLDTAQEAENICRDLSLNNERGHVRSDDGSSADFLECPDYSDKHKNGFEPTREDARPEAPFCKAEPDSESHDIRHEECTKEFFLDIERLIEEDFPYSVGADGYGPFGESGKRHMLYNLKTGYIGSYYFYDMLRQIVQKEDERDRKVASMTEQEKQEIVKRYMEKLDVDYPCPSDKDAVFRERNELQEKISKMEIIDDETYHSKLDAAIKGDGKKNELIRAFPELKKRGRK